MITQDDKRIVPCIFSIKPQFFFAFFKTIFVNPSCSMSSDIKSIHFSLSMQSCYAEILKAKYDTSSSILRNRLSWDTLAIRRKKQKAVLMYKCLNGLVPNYLQNLFTHRCTSYNLRNQEYKITLPKPRTDFLKRSFSYSGAKLWNDLPLSIRSSSSLAKFKREINLIF